jgi:hypothetical protein
MFLYRLNALTGEMLSVTPINSRDPETDLPPQKEGAPCDDQRCPTSSCDGRFVYATRV